VISISWIGKAFKKVVGFFRKVGRGLRELFFRALDILGFVGDLIGIRPQKYLKLKVYILLNQNSAPVQQKKEVKRWLTETIKIFEDRANVQVYKGDEDNFIDVTFPEAPTYALNPECGFFVGFGEAADYYESYIDNNYGVDASFWGQLKNWLGYGEGIFVFIVVDIPGKNGCAFPFYHDFCVVIREPMTTTMTHEIGHMCGVPDSGRRHNLMNSNRDDMESRLTRWQIAVLRNSKYVTYTK
jgi:hypothetical protein